MHELAGCRVLASAGPVDGYVTSYAAGVLRLSLEGPLVGRTVGDQVTVTVLDPVRGECTYRGLVDMLRKGLDFEPLPPELPLPNPPSNPRFARDIARMLTPEYQRDWN